MRGKVRPFDKHSRADGPGFSLSVSAKRSNSHANLPHSLWALHHKPLDPVLYHTRSL